MQISPETQLFIREHQTDDVRALALQARKYPNVDMPTAITQIAGRQVAAEKIPSWRDTDDIWYPKHLSLEQCSSEVTASYKATLLKGNSLTDLTGGFGIDCAFLAARFKSATYVERQQELCEIAAHNFPILNLNHINVKNEDGVSYLQAMSPVDCIFLDPARRNEHGGKTVAISDCEPDVAELEELLLNKAEQVMVMKGFKLIDEKGQDARFEYMDQFVTASFYAGIAFLKAGCGPVHGMSFPLGGTYHVPHGESNYMLFGAIMDYYDEHKPDGEIMKFKELVASILGCEVKDAIPEMNALLQRILPLRPLRDCGFTEADFKAFPLSVEANQQRLMTNAYYPFDLESEEAIYRKCY